MRRLAYMMVLVSGCATYHPKPLPNAPDLSSVLTLTVPVSRLDLPGLKPHPFNPTNRLDETTVITLAVLNNPDLKAARLRAGVARAQVLEAGLLPDPQVSGGLSRSTLHTGYSIGLGEDIQALITRGAAKAAAKAHEREVNLQILWQEWQVAEKARELFIQMRADAGLHNVLTTNRDLLAERYRQDKAALERNNVMASTVTTDSTALTDANAQLRQLEIQMNENRHALNQLLGLKPNVVVPLTGLDETGLPSEEAFDKALAALPHRRPDLLALQAGYQSQEETLRKAVLAQFPAMSAGVQKSRSAEEGINSIGLTVNVTLPLFNRNRGQIAIERATRAVLNQTYQARLDQTVNEADQVFSATHILSRQLQSLVARLAVLEKAASGAKENFESGTVDLGTYVTLESEFLNGRANAIQQRAAVEQAKSALDALLCLPFAN
jgi:outer membrane protein, heavy metal efflux system